MGAVFATFSIFLTCCICNVFTVDDVIFEMCSVRVLYV